MKKRLKIPKGAIGSRKYNDQMKQDKHQSTKHYTENYTSSNKNPTKNRGELRCIKEYLNHQNSFYIYAKLVLRVYF